MCIRDRYQAFVGGKAVDPDTAGAVVVNTSGSIMKNKKNLKDADDMYYCTDSKGHVTGYSDIKCGSKKSDGTVYKCTNEKH